MQEIFTFSKPWVYSEYMKEFETVRRLSYCYYKFKSKMRNRGTIVTDASRNYHSKDEERSRDDY